MGTSTERVQAHRDRTRTALALDVMELLGSAPGAAVLAALGELPPARLDRLREVLSEASVSGLGNGDRVRR